MKNFLLIAMTAATLSACGRRTITGNGESTSVTRTVSGSITKIDISAPVTAKIHVQPGAMPTVVFTGYKNIIEEIRTEVEGNTLEIENRHSVNFDTDEDIVADITVGSLEELEIHGAGDAYVNGAITGDAFILKVSGAGNASVDNITVGHLEAKISGAGNLDINSGTVKDAEYKVSGAGNINSFGLQAENVTAKVSGAGDINVSASKTLHASVSGAGNVQYKGSPSVNAETSGIGSVAAAR